MSALQERIEASINRFPGNVWIYAKNLRSGADFGVRPDEPVRTASTIKLPIMIALFTAVEQGKVKWTDTLTLKPEEKVSGSGVLTEFSDGIKLPVADVMHLMIVVSDNTATNLILDLITADYVNQQMEKLGLRRTRSLRKVLGKGAPRGISAAGRIKENERFGLGVTTTREMVLLLERLERGQLVSPAASKEMLAIMKRQQFKDGIGRQTSYEVVSKSGSLDRLRSDVGIIYPPQGPLAIAITVDDMERTDYSPDNVGNILISELTHILLDELA